jgi:hypothetical protein
MEELAWKRGWYAHSRMCGTFVDFGFVEKLRNKFIQVINVRLVLKSKTKYMPPRCCKPRQSIYNQNLQLVAHRIYPPLKTKIKCK